MSTSVMRRCWGLGPLLCLEASGDFVHFCYKRGCEFCPLLVEVAGDFVHFWYKKRLGILSNFFDKERLGLVSTSDVSRGWTFCRLTI